MAIEIEKKYRLTRKLSDEIAASLEELGAEYRGEDDEENTLFSSSDLAAQNAVIRLRTTGTRSILTFKRRQVGTSNHKIQEEHETEIADAAALRTVLEKIGLKAVLVYEKKRKAYKLRNAEVVLDELPFGLFMEIEGSVTAIAEAETLLGIETLEVENETYPRLTVRNGVRKGELIEARFTPA